ncbi:MAG: bifunctional 4-hydroxy-2-oxoglutarate aldolase/2-dehydro-3-deoxy-phosphogluconate aldolase [Planctomycetota bacterium]|nr:bifunctional 4-hydroxy-2-oxoglutarate aldolase/2-dehydro-3-deoxy-phosphogluconate aldolase [Planctomycetota bacterium]
MPLSPESFVTILGQSRASAILRTPHGDLAVDAMKCAIAAGFTICEFTLTIPGALQHIETIAAQFPDVVVGAGTVLTPDQARDAVSAGARFLVSPVLDCKVVEIATELGVAIIPGCSTPTEMLAAHEAGAPLVKLFPGPAGGPRWVQAVLGPLPFLKIIPTSGVGLHNASEFLNAGAHAIGFVSPLFSPEAIEKQQWPQIEQRGRELLAACRQAR